MGRARRAWLDPRNDHRQTVEERFLVVTQVAEDLLRRPVSRVRAPRERVVAAPGDRGDELTGRLREARQPRLAWQVPVFLDRHGRGRTRARGSRFFRSGLSRPTPWSWIACTTASLTGVGTPTRRPCRQT